MVNLVKCLLCSDSSGGEIAVNGDASEQGQSLAEDSNASDEKTNGKTEEGGTGKDKLYDDQEEIRQHLINTHAAEVATAFLYPNIGDEKHLWLMSCVQYGGPLPGSTHLEGMTVDEETGEIRDEEGSRIESAEKSPLDENALADRDENWTEDSDSQQQLGDIDFSQLLSAFLNSAASGETAAVGEGNGEKKRRADRMLINENNKAKLSKFESDIFMNDELNGEMTDGVTSSGGPIPVDSKAKNKVICSLCGVSVCNTARQRHVYIVHVSKSDMYKCPECDYTNSNSIWETRKHCIAQHGQGVEPVSNEEKYKSIIIHYNRACFPDWKQKRPSTWAQQQKGDESMLDSLLLLKDEESRASSGVAAVESSGRQSTHNNAADDITNLIRDAIFNAPMKAEEGVSGKSSPLLMPNYSDALSPGTDRLCHLCGEESRYPGRHIAQKHLQYHLYECSVCNNFGSYEGSTVSKHIHKQHPDAPPNTQPINNLAKFADEIRELQTRCFPNRPTKLVKSNEARQRERHQCNKCNKQVAQSDRARHVYHVHLQKQSLFECPIASCAFSSSYDVHRVKWHIKWEHKAENLEPISHENEYRDEIDALNDECFPNWMHRKKTFWWLDGNKVDGDSESLEGNSTTTQRLQTDVSFDNDTLDDIKLEIDESAGASDVNRKIGQPMKKVSEWTCRLCLKEFKPTSNFLRHVAKDHLPFHLFQCPACEEGAPDVYEVKAHMVKTHSLADLDPISNLEMNADFVQAKFQECFPQRQMKPEMFKKTDVMEVDESRVTCQECFQEMKNEDRQIHVYRHHLKIKNLYECPLCSFTHYASSSDVRNHIKSAHKEQANKVSPKSNVLKFSEAIAECNDKCFPNWINRKLPTSIMEDFSSCRLCNKDVRQTSRHIAEVHLKIQLHACPLCSYGGAEARLVKRHLKSIHHEEELDPISNVIARRADFSALHDQCFPGRPKRFAVPYNNSIDPSKQQTKCKVCSASILKKNRLQHTLEQHMRIKAYKCSECEFNHKSDDKAVIAHIHSTHSGHKGAKVLNNLTFFEDEVRDSLAMCFVEKDCVIEDTVFKPFQDIF